MRVRAQHLSCAAAELGAASRRPCLFCRSVEATLSWSLRARPDPPFRRKRRQGPSGASKRTEARGVLGEVVRGGAGRGRG